MSVRTSQSPISSNLNRTRTQQPQTQPPSRNPVSQRLYKVLGTSFDDPVTQDALRTLSELYVPSNTQSNGLGDHNKGAKDGEDETDENDEVEDAAGSNEWLGRGSSGTGVGEGSAAATARNYLRRDMERKLAEGSREFLKAFGDADQRLEEVEAHIAALRASCDEAEALLQQTTDSSKALLDRASNLRSERSELQSRLSLSTVFISRFTLSENEIEALTSREVPVGRRFFDAMDKTERIRQECRVLMEGEDGPTKAGLDIIATTSTYLEEGYDKIFKWCTYEFQKLGREPQLDAGDNTNVSNAVRRLRQRPELLSPALTTLATARSSTLSSSFLRALTRGTPRPIELHAHDPLRYVGDMLAWVHQAIAAEREGLEGIFGVEGDGRMVGSVRQFGNKGKAGVNEGVSGSESEEEELIRELIDYSVGKLCGPLKTRIQQTIRAHGQESSGITAYKLANLLNFYALTMQGTIGPDAVLSQTLQEMTDAGYKVFYDAIEAQGRALLRFVLDPTDTSVTPPNALLEHVARLREIISAHEDQQSGSSPSYLVSGSDTPEDERVKKILDAMIDPVVEMCSRIANERQDDMADGPAGRTRKGKGKELDRGVWVLNCLTYLQSVLDAYRSTQTKRRMVQEVVEERVRMLTDKHYEDLLREGGIRDQVKTCRELRDRKEPISHDPTTAPATLQRALHTFAGFLSSPTLLHSPRLSLLTSQILHEKIHRAALERVAEAYGELCAEVRKPENRYEAAATMLGSERPFGKIGVLRQIFGLSEIGAGVMTAS